MSQHIRTHVAVASIVAMVMLGPGCSGGAMGLSDGEVAIGTWGGDDAGVIVADTLTHVHIGCTYGDVPGRVAVDSGGRFVVAGSYTLHAYPVAVGPTMPAQFSGAVNGTTLTFSVTVTDTIAHTVTTLGPATVVLGKEPQMGPCPICRTPGDRASARRRAISR